jgi:hypothetical protein
MVSSRVNRPDTSGAQRGRNDRPDSRGRKGRRHRNKGTEPLYAQGHPVLVRNSWQVSKKPLRRPKRHKPDPYGMGDGHAPKATVHESNATRNSLGQPLPESSTPPIA